MKYLLNKLENQICTLTINRPEQYNALNINVLKEQDNSLDWILNETDAKVVIITGKGDILSISLPSEEEVTGEEGEYSYYMDYSEDSETDIPLRQFHNYIKDDHY